MAIFVGLWKVEESNDAVEYDYGPKRTVVGRLRILKQSGQYEVVSPLDIPNAAYQTKCAVMKLSQYFKEGFFPDTGAWQS